MRDGVRVTLTPGEMYAGALVGIVRQANALRDNLHNKYNDPNADHNWSIHIEGACGELAAAKVLNVYWSPTQGTFRDCPDIGGAFEVRTRSQHWHDLIVRPDDRDDLPYVLVTGLTPYFVVRGWILGRDAKRDEWWKRPGGVLDYAWFVPQEALRELPKQWRAVVA